MSLLQHSAALAVGIRPARARTVETLFALLTSVLYGIRDPLCGMKGYRMALYRELGHFDSYGSVGTELALYAAKRRYRIAQFKVPIARRLGPSRFGDSLKANWQFLRALIRGLLCV